MIEFVQSPRRELFQADRPRAGSEQHPVRAAESDFAPQLRYRSVRTEPTRCFATSAPNRSVDWLRAPLPAVAGRGEMIHSCIRDVGE